ncbi:fibronectin type III domain-containing protein [bacterium]|nr:fibronectin type III domain-containing protein [candidate division CSSED10-310 bacterium]
MGRVAFLFLILLLVIPVAFAAAQEPSAMEEGEVRNFLSPQADSAGIDAVVPDDREPEPVTQAAGMEESPEPPSRLMAEDTQGDDGTSVTLTWEVSPDEDITAYDIFMKDVTDDSPLVDVIRLRPKASEYRDADTSGERIRAGHEYVYFIRSRRGELVSDFVASPPVKPDSEWFNTDASNIQVVAWVLLICAAFTYYIFQGRKGKTFAIRPIAGIQNIDDALGRATEMGRPILYVLGIGDIEYISTIAGLTILGRVAKKAAEYDTPILVPCFDYITFPVAQEIVRTAYSDAGRPDAFKSDSVYYVTSSQFAYVSNVCGTMQRELPATNFFLGFFRAESLILAEAGAATGAIQIAGTDSDDQLPFFITACDYTLIGEELYAASAYLSKEPVLLGTLKGQDFGKALILLWLLVGAILLIFGQTFFLDWFPVQ